MPGVTFQARLLLTRFCKKKIFCKLNCFDQSKQMLERKFNHRMDELNKGFVNDHKNETMEKILNRYIILLSTHLYHTSFQYLSITCNAFM